MSAFLTPLQDWLKTQKIPRRTFYDWLNAGKPVPRPVRIGRKCFITQEQDLKWRAQVRAMASGMGG